jgi:hypothetical protein
MMPLMQGAENHEKPSIQEEEEVNEGTHTPDSHAGGLLRRQMLFLKKTWWSSEPLTGAQRVALLLRGVVFVAVGGIGLVAAIANTVSAEATGMQAVAKMMAEFLLIPVAILGLIILGFGGSLIVRSFVSPSPDSHISD